MESTNNIFSILTIEEKYRNNIRNLKKRQTILEKFTEFTVSVGNIQTVFDKAVELISNELKPTSTRISTFDSQGSFLNSQALKATDLTGTVTPPTGSMILSLMPYHRLIKEKGRTLLINQDKTDLKLSEVEQNQFSRKGLNSALLIPLKVNQTVIGVISLGERRNWSQYHFNTRDIKFVQSIASLISIALKVQTKKTKRQEDNTDLSSNNLDDVTASFDRRSRLKSSLSGIMGSVEILRKSENPDNKNYEKCLSIIDKSVKKISESFLTEG